MLQPGQSCHSTREASPQGAGHTHAPWPGRIGRPAPHGTGSFCVFRRPLTSDITQRRSLKEVSLAHSKQTKQSSLEKTNEAPVFRQCQPTGSQATFPAPETRGSSTNVLWEGVTLPSTRSQTPTALRQTWCAPHSDRQRIWACRQHMSVRTMRLNKPLVRMAKSEGASTCHLFWGFSRETLCFCPRASNRQLCIQGSRA